MDNNELTHWGVKGMRWGVRRYQNKDGTLTKAGQKRYDKELAKAKEEAKLIRAKERTQAKLDKLSALKADNESRRKALDEREEAEKPVKETKTKTNTKRSIYDLSDDELKTVIDRIRMEQTYKDLTSPPKKEKTSKGKEMVTSILENSSKNIGGQLVTYVMGTAVNKMMAKAFGDPRVVNPKKGQKDK